MTVKEWLRVRDFDGVGRVKMALRTPSEMHCTTTILNTVPGIRWVVG